MAGKDAGQVGVEPEEPNPECSIGHCSPIGHSNATGHCCPVASVESSNPIEEQFPLLRDQDMEGNLSVEIDPRD